MAKKAELIGVCSSGGTPPEGNEARLEQPSLSPIE